MPANAPNADAKYPIRCQIAYKNNKIPHPKTELEEGRVRTTSDLLNKWLKEFIEDQYVGVEFSELIATFEEGDFADDLRDEFEWWVEDKIATQDLDACIDVEIVDVHVYAEGELSAELVELWRQQSVMQ